VAALCGPDVQAWALCTDIYCVQTLQSKIFHSRMTDPASSPAAVGCDSAAAAAATVSLADARAERDMLLEILELQDEVHELLIVMRKQKIDCTYVAERRSIICKLPVTDQVQALQKLIVWML
jgi:hypothetical protein